MKFTLTLELALAPERSPLLHISWILAEHHFLPDSLIWSAMPGMQEARIWLQVEADPVRVENLAHFLRASPPVRKVVIQVEAARVAST